MFEIPIPINKKLSEKELNSYLDTFDKVYKKFIKKLQPKLDVSFNPGNRLEVDTNIDTAVFSLLGYSIIGREFTLSLEGIRKISYELLINNQNYFESLLFNTLVEEYNNLLKSIISSNPSRRSAHEVLHYRNHPHLYIFTEAVEVYESKEIVYAFQYNQNEYIINTTHPLLDFIKL